MEGGSHGTPIPRRGIGSRPDGTIQPAKRNKWRDVSDGCAAQKNDRTGNRMAQQKTNPKLEQALTRGDLAIRQANSARATALLRALG